MIISDVINGIAFVSITSKHIRCPSIYLDVLDVVLVFARFV
jgi:hypothetical protein